MHQLPALILPGPDERFRDQGGTDSRAVHYFAGPCDWWVAEYDPYHHRFPTHPQAAAPSQSTALRAGHGHEPRAEPACGRY